MTMLDGISTQDSEIIELHDLLKLAIGNLKETLENHVDLLKETHSATLQKSTINLSATLEKVNQSIHSLISHSQAKISSDFTAFNEVMFNQSNLESIFLNFLSNSIKYSIPGVPPVIKFYTRVNGNKQQFVVEDNGQGFDTEIWEDKTFGICEKSNDNPDSKGVGLYLVFNHVINMGGKIEVQSKINVGTTFIITFKRDRSMEKNSRL